MGWWMMVVMMLMVLMVQLNLKSSGINAEYGSAFLMFILRLLPKRSWNPARCLTVGKEASVDLEGYVSHCLRLLRLASKTGRDKAGIIPKTMATDFFEIYQGLNWESKKRFLVLLSTMLSVDEDEVLRIAKLIIEKHKHTHVPSLCQSFRESLDPYHNHLFSYLIDNHPVGMSEVLSLRVDLLGAINQEKEYHWCLNSMNRNLEKILQHWFSMGFLSLERITWDSPASLLEKCYSLFSENWVDFK
eukprot:TRINITY_DN13166_c0_g1_i1.p1 TRINITY_DN13166_c0_g1~~TRINITY_DN13166_c0_g1_i1.p1  ORF type:complete len:245 (-),score=53.10 TRINITY_DN13166_c0_g1_i1:543-1277(-)